MTLFEFGGMIAIGMVTVLAAGALVVEYRQGRMSPMRVWTGATAPITALYCFLDASRSPWLEAKFTEVSWAIGMWALLGVVLILLEAVRSANQTVKPVEAKPLTPSPIVPSLSNPTGDSLTGPHSPK